MVTPLLLAALIVSAEMPVAGRVVAAQGQASALRAHKLTPLKRGDLVFQGDEIETSENSAVRILLQDNSVLDLASNSDMKLEAFAYQPKSQSRLAKITMLIGKLWARVTPSLGSEQNFNISTPNAVAGVRGTSLVVDVSNKGETQVTVVNGSVAVRDTRGGSQTLGPLMQSTVNKQGHTVNNQVSNTVLSGLKNATTVKPNLGGDGSNGRLQAINAIMVNGSAGVGREQGPPSRTLQSPRDTTAPTTNAAPPIELDPSKNIARVRVNVHIKE